MVSAEPASSTWTQANRVAAQAVNMNSPILTAATGTPTLRAALGSPPQAKIQLPTRVRSRMKVAPAVRTSHQTIDIEMPEIAGAPSARVPMRPMLGEPDHQRAADLAGEERRQPVLLGQRP